jgi:hypothetical protein
MKTKHLENLTVKEYAFTPSLNNCIESVTLEYSPFAVKIDLMLPTLYSDNGKL